MNSFQTVEDKWLYLLGSTNISVDCCVPSWDPETSAWIQQLNQDQPSGSMLHLLYFAHFQLFSKRFMKFWNSNLQDLDNTSTTKSLLDKNRSHPPQQKSLHRRKPFTITKLRHVSSSGSAVASCNSTCTAYNDSTGVQEVDIAHHGACKGTHKKMLWGMKQQRFSTWFLWQPQTTGSTSLHSFGNCTIHPWSILKLWSSRRSCFMLLPFV